MKRLLFFLTICCLSLSILAQEQKIDPSKTPVLENPEKAEIEYNFDDLLNAPKSAPVTITGKVVSVYDGDTAIVLDANKRQHKIRFNGIDAPEAKQDFGNRSKQNLSGLIFGKEVTVKSDKTDKYGRTVGNVYVSGIDVNLEQIKGGFAWHYKKYQSEQTETDRKLYADAEINARMQKLGLWAFDNPTPPWDWRRGVNHPNLAGVPTGSIIGNANSKIYHTPRCSTYARVSAKNRILFRSEKEAVEAGYRISSGCETSIPIEERPKSIYVKKVYQKGSRGGCYYLNAIGKKVYVDKQLCN